MKFHFIFLVLISVCGYSQSEMDVYITTAENYMDSHEITYNYMLANNVNLRQKPSSKSKRVENLKIGQKIIVLKKSDKMDSINGIKANWYQVKTDYHKGWIWGGYIAQNSFGSESNTSIKFVFGLEKIALEDGWTQKYYQLRAFKDTVELDKVVFKSYSLYIEYIISGGNKGLDLDDVISIGIPCVGGCGCTTGELVVFWDGKYFSEIEYLLGTADAWASEQITFTYPTNMDGLENKIIKTTFLFIDSVGEDKIKRRKIVEHYTWKRNHLILDRTFKKQVETYVISR